MLLPIVVIVQKYVLVRCCTFVREVMKVIELLSYGVCPMSVGDWCSIGIRQLGVQGVGG